jgi:hypothetical protein
MSLYGITSDMTAIFIIKENDYNSKLMSLASQKVDFCYALISLDQC